MPSALISAVALVALLNLYVGERIVDNGTPRAVVSGFGAALLLAAIALRAMRLKAAVGDKRRVENALLGLLVVTAAAVAVYFATSDVFARLDGRVLSADSPKLAGVLSVLWPALLVAAVTPIFLIELAYLSMERGDKIELGRVRDAMMSGLGMAGAIIFSFALIYVFSVRDVRWDLAYFRTAKASEATKKIVAGLDEPLKVFTFFPKANEVGDSLDGYLADLKSESPKLEVERLDQALDPARSRELGVSANGAIVLSRGARKETLLIGTDLEKARGSLMGIDLEFQKKLLVIARQKKPLYYTVGHGERTDEPVSPTDQRATVALLKNGHKDLNYELRPLGVEQGLANEVPKDAAAVLSFGPTEDFTDAEAAALEKYVKRGGRMLFAIDPEAGKKQEAVLSRLGLEFVPTVLASDVAYAPKTYQLSDRTIIGTNTFSSHPSVTQLARTNYALYLMAAGHLEEAKSHPAEISIDFSVRSHPSTWDDANGNFQHDPPAETRKSWQLVAAVSRRPPQGGGKPEDEARAIVIADSDALADEVLGRAPGNGAFATDAVKWLLGDEAISGTANTETDVVIQRSRTSDRVWFYGTMFLAPALVVAIGYLASRKRGARAPRRAAGVKP